MSKEACYQLWEGLLDRPGNDHTTFVQSAGPPLQAAFEIVNGTIEVDYDKCWSVCGGRVAAYTWDNLNPIATTWTVPVLILFANAPFESNRTKRNLYLCTRWLASPPCALAAVLQRVKDDADCANMADAMAGSEKEPDFTTLYERYRDSFFILAVMNQFTIKSGDCAISLGRLLEVALFDDQVGKDEDSLDLVQLRRGTAIELRKSQRKGSVPIFVSLGVFLFGLGISVANAISTASIAQGLDIGSFLAWVPALVVLGVVERNSDAPKDVRTTLNQMMQQVHNAMVKEQHETRQQALACGTTVPPLPNCWHLQCLSDLSLFGRDRGRGELRVEPGLPRPHLARLRQYVQSGKPPARLGVDGFPDEAGIFSGERGAFNGSDYSVRALAMFIFLACALSTIGYLLGKPPIGMGCLSGFYFLYTILALVQAAVEFPYHSIVRRRLATQMADAEAGRAAPTSIAGTAERAHTIVVWFLTTLQMMNCLLIIFILAARTGGVYDTCWCRFVHWAPVGTRAVFTVPVAGLPTGFTEQIAALLVPAIVMVMAIAGALYVWCAHRHLGGEDPVKARAGLVRARRFRRRLVWPVHLLVGCYRRRTRSQRRARP